MLLDGKVVKASYNAGVRERFVHLSQVETIETGERKRFIVGAKVTVKNRHGEWGAGLSLLDALEPALSGQARLVSFDAGMTVQLFAAWMTNNYFFYLGRVKGNSGHLFDWVKQWAEKVCNERLEGDYFESIRLSSDQMHSRRLWRVILPEASCGIFSGIRDVVIVDKTDLSDNSTDRQYFVTSYPSQAWSCKEMLERILLHWDTETGIFGVKDRTFSEDKARYASVEGAMARTFVDNVACNFLRAPVFESFWLPEAPLSHRLQFWRDQPDYCPFLQEPPRIEVQEDSNCLPWVERTANWLAGKIRWFVIPGAQPVADLN